MQVKKQQLELDVEQWTGSKLGKEYVKEVYCHPAYLTYMRVYHEKCQVGWLTSLNKDYWEKYQQSQNTDDITLMAESEKELKSLLTRVKEESEKGGLKLNIHRTNIMSSGPITSWQICGEKVETVTDFIFLGSKIMADGDCSH